MQQQMLLWQAAWAAGCIKPKFQKHKRRAPLLKKGLPFFLVFGTRQKQFNLPSPKPLKRGELKPLSPLLLQGRKRLSLLVLFINKVCVFDVGQAQNNARWVASLDAEAAISVRELYSIQRVPRSRLKNTHTIKMKFVRISTYKTAFSPTFARKKAVISVSTLYK